MPSTVVIGGFFGDEGKGKIISYLALHDKPTIVALREIEEGLLDSDTLEEWLKDDILSDGFSAEPVSQEGESIG